MKEASISSSQELFTVSLDDYPCTSLSDALCKLSEHGPAKIFPTGINPQLPWIWEFRADFRSALSTLLLKHGYVISNTHEQT